MFKSSNYFIHTHLSSFELGVDMFELDCHITKDGKVVVAHDNNLNRLCGVDKLISETNYDVKLRSV